MICKLKGEARRGVEGEKMNGSERTDQLFLTAVRYDRKSFAELAWTSFMITLGQWFSKIVFGVWWRCAGRILKTLLTVLQLVRCLFLHILSPPFQSTGCNRIRYTTLKIYCDQIDSNITTQFVTEHLLTLQDFFTNVQYGCHWLCGRHPDYILIRPTVCPRKWRLSELRRKLEYRMDVCRITSGSHTEHL
jgi:hypothetical protein